MKRKALGFCPTPGCHSTNFYFMVRLSNSMNKSYYRCRPCGKVFSVDESLSSIPKVADAKIKTKKPSKRVSRIAL